MFFPLLPYPGVSPCFLYLFYQLVLGPCNFPTSSVRNPAASAPELQTPSLPSFSLFFPPQWVQIVLRRTALYGTFRCVHVASASCLTVPICHLNCQMKLYCITIITFILSLLLLLGGTKYLCPLRNIENHELLLKCIWACEYTSRSSKECTTRDN